MALSEGQVQVRDLVMGPGTSYGVNRFNAFRRRVRKNSNARPWGHGSWHGAQWRDERVVRMDILVADDIAGGMSSWMDLDQELARAWAPIGDQTSVIEMRWRLGGREYAVFGVPGDLGPEEDDQIGLGWSLHTAEFIGLDPLMYDGVETSVDGIGLPSWSGGLEVPLTVPFTIDATAAAGVAELTNEGTADTGLLIRLDGPVETPIVTLVRADGTFQQLTIDLTLSSGQWIDLDTKNRTALLNGAHSRRGQVFGQWPILPKGTHELRWRSGTFNSTAQMSVTFRSAWW